MHNFLEIHQEIVNCLSEGKEAALVTIVSASRSTPRGAGARMLVKPDGSIMGTIGGGMVEAEAINIARRVIRSEKSELHKFSLTPDKEPGMVCGGEMDIFVEPVLQTPMIYLFGAGHISLALARIGKLLGFRLTVIDDRPDYANEKRFPDADNIVVDNFAQSFNKIRIDKHSYIVIMTRSHTEDESVLEQALLTKAGYIGMIGSKTKVKTIFHNLKNKGIENDLLDKVHSPIGLEIFAETPEEIAISILAEIVKVKCSPRMTGESCLEDYANSLQVSLTPTRS
jgi:xanthine dehydrogenase accessory factor